MVTDDLTTPLGQDTKPPRAWLRYRLPVTMPQALAGLLGLFLLTFLGFALFHDDPLGGEPMVTVAIPPSAITTDKTEAAKSASAPPPAAPAASAPAPVATPAPAAAQAGDQKTITIIDGSSGSRRDVLVPLNDSDAKPASASTTPPVSATVNPQLLESSRYGMIPIAAGGLKPWQAYAAGNDALRAKAMTMPVVAVVIGGLGIGAAKTSDAIMKLPGAVTLAFTPYGSEPGKLVERARTQGHEVLLQIPLEPFDYPDNDPGPQTLLTSLRPEQNLDRLFWHLSRFQGYVGLSNFMGGKFVPNEASMQPLIGEAAKRGLAYFDDGAASRSVSQQVSATQTVPFAKADVTIDAMPNAAEIDRALAQLEATAKQRGFAVGAASALPLSIERIGSWAKTLESRGLLLVPLTTAMMKSKSN